MTEHEQLPDPIEPNESDPRIQAALADLRDLILQRFPEAVFSVARGDDPDGIYLTATVDVDDLDEVTDAVVSRMVDMQVDEGLPVFVVPDWPLHRVSEHLRRMAEQPVE